MTASEDAGIQVITIKVAQGKFINNCYLVINCANRAAVIIDPAWQLDKIQQIMQQCQVDLQGILVTHAHDDHINLAQPLADRYHCPIWLSQQEAEHSGYYAEQLQLFNEQVLEIGGMAIQTIITPGHTPGSSCFQIGHNVFTGDTLFAEGVGLCPDREAATTLFNSVQQLKQRLAADALIYPGHTFVKTPGQRMDHLYKMNIYLALDECETFVNFRMRPNQDKSRWMAFS
ncbi:MBL fold metallo-hydrolase [Pantoea sp. A4]|uniref:MBL fold metallo-hydrolase n=1 Tax=Pantoea sp. A4 TaxID=1225184 RepID=UPI000366E2BC|nr:MBL fold metallo-hydrolase [Pantoea sp. A4]